MMLIHKETFYQTSHEGVPGHWVVQYWEDSPYGFPEASYFSEEIEARDFENELVAYDDWCSSQEISLATQ